MPLLARAAAASARWLQRQWWQPAPTLAMQLLRPLSWLLSGLARWRSRQAPRSLPVPVLVVGNLIVGGAGKTPTVMALLPVLRSAGWHPGVVSRGHGRKGDAPVAVEPGSAPADVGDEPLLIRRRAGVPVWVGRSRVDAARALCAAHPGVDLLVADDGLQHRALPRRVEVIVFDERGAGNGLRLPAGPLRERLPGRLAATQRVLYNADRPSTALPGALARRRPGPVLALADWQAGRADAAVPLSALRGRPLLAVAGIAAPERFFGMLEAEGLSLLRLPLPDHHDYRHLPWPDDTGDVVTTEKDAVKLPAASARGPAIWVVGLDFALPEPFIRDVLRLLGRPPTTASPR